MAAQLALFVPLAADAADEPCATLLMPDAVAVHIVEDLGFDCEAGPCYNTRATATEGRGSIDVAAIVLCPATPQDGDALRLALDRLPFEPTLLIGHRAERMINGRRAAVLVATRVVPGAE